MLKAFSPTFVASDYNSDHHHLLRKSRDRKQGGLLGEGHRAEIHLVCCDLPLETEITLIFFHSHSLLFNCPFLHPPPFTFHLSPFTLHSLHYFSPTSTTLCFTITINIHHSNHQYIMSNMSSPLSEVDRELLGEVLSNNGAEATMAKANGEAGTEAHDDHPGATFTPLNATAGTSVEVSSNGDEVETGKVSQHIRVSPYLSLIMCSSPSLIISAHTFILYTSQIRSDRFTLSRLSVPSPLTLCRKKLCNCTLPIYSKPGKA